jgi:hypothetical protein
VGDFNKNMVLDAADLDSLTAAILSGSFDSRMDLNNDGALSSDDRTLWITEIAGTSYGDANLDGMFGTGDLVSVFQAGEFENGVASDSTWSTGDWNGDREFDSSDLVSAFASGRYEQTIVAAVPEPGLLSVGTALAVFGLIGVLRRDGSPDEHKENRVGRPLYVETLTGQRHFL